MLNKIFPKKIDNVYSGSKIALYAFAIITAVTLIRSLIHIFAIDGGAQSIAGFPIDTYSSEAAKLVILIFSLWGSSQLITAIVYLIVLIKYKSLIPLMYLLFIFEYLLRLFIGIYKPAISVHTVPGGIADYLAVPLGLILLILATKGKRFKFSK